MRVPNSSTLRDVRAAGPAIASSPIETALTEAVSAGVTDLLPWPGDEQLYLHSPAMRLAVEAVRAANSRKAGILFVGPSGSGRALIARSRHALDNDYVSQPFVSVDCDVTSAADLERRIFGSPQCHDSGSPAFLESVDRTGALVGAQGGSLFLENLTAAPARVQARLASVLRDREVFSVDAGEVIRVDVRVMASVDADVDGAVGEGRLRRDLVDLMAGVRIDVPPFGSRREDLPFLALRFLCLACEADGLVPKRFSRAALALMSALPWNGNGPEMANVVAAIVRGTRQAVIQIDDVLKHVSLDPGSESQSSVGPLRDARARFEREHISAALVRHRGRVGDAARQLGIQRTNLYRKVRQLKVSKELLASGR